MLEPYAATSAGFYLYYPQRSQVLPKLRAFIDHIREGSKRLKVSNPFIRGITARPKPTSEK